jgi:tagatose 1,6-diphosphate aldolase
VEKIKRAGGDGVKVLAWYRPDAEPDVLAHQQNYVERIGEECRQWDIPLVLELLVYPFPRSERHTVDYIESPEKMPELVIESVREFAKPRYGVDLFKLESPLPGASLPARDGSAAQQAAQGWFDQMGAICKSAGIPWVMLSAGVTPPQFLRVMAYAYAAGAHGFLAGRAVWWQALQHFPDLERCAEQLRREGSATLAELEALTLRAGSAWQADYSAFDAMKAEGELCAAYA